MLHPKIVQCFNNLGILVDEEIENFVVSEFIEDSLAYVSFIVELEEIFSIDIPDEFLNNEALNTYEDVVQMIKHLAPESMNS